MVVGGGSPTGISSRLNVFWGGDTFLTCAGEALVYT